MVRSAVQPPTLVDTPETLKTMLSCLEDVPFIAIDCEMDSFYSYWGKVCLIQIGDGSNEWIVDPLALDVRPLGELLADGKRIKLFHDGRCVLECIWQLGNNGKLFTGILLSQCSHYGC